VSRTALILSGGGARGAYEVGVLSYVFDHFARVRRRDPKIDLVLGTSVGAINGCFLASHLQDAPLGTRRLANLWSDIHMDEVLRFGPSQMAALPRLLRGGGAEATGVFDVTPMARLVEREVQWRSISRALRDRRLLGLAVSATEVQSGRTTVFMQTAPDVGYPTTMPPRTQLHKARIGPIHALASAAIPVLFPPVRVGARLFMDGGVRQNTPIAPALRLGATHVFAIGLSTEGAEPELPSSEKPPNVAFVIGKIMNAFLLDHITSDFEILDRVNAFLDLGTQVYGAGFLDTLNQAAEASGQPPLRRVHTLVIRPSEDLGKLAQRNLKSGVLRGGPALRAILGLLDVGSSSDADLASYLLFDGAFARKLIELGRADAEQKRTEIDGFFESAEGDPA
jgi:NTE family protein